MSYANTCEAFIAFVDCMLDGADDEVLENFPGAVEFFESMKSAREILILSEDTYADTWSIKDVKDVAPYLSDEEAREVLALAVNEEFDAVYGVNWSGLEMCASEYYDRKYN